MSNTILAQCTTCTAKDQEIARLTAELAATQQRLILPGWNVPINGQTLHELRIMARDGHAATRYDVYIGDLDRLKQWNTATGSQLITDSYLAPALAVRRGDALLEGAVDNADMFIFVFPSGAGDTAIYAKQSALRHAPIPLAIRRSFVQALCRLRHGEIEGDRAYGRYLAGQEEIVDYPTMTIRAFHDVAPADLEPIFHSGDTGVFQAKAVNQRGGLVLEAYDVA